MHYTFIHLINIYQVPTCASRYWVYRRESGIFYPDLMKIIFFRGNRQYTSEYSTDLH